MHINFNLNVNDQCKFSLKLTIYNLFPLEVVHAKMPTLSTLCMGKLQWIY